jgi:hypothetical protein
VAARISPQLREDRETLAGGKHVAWTRSKVTWAPNLDDYKTAPCPNQS